MNKRLRACNVVPSAAAALALSFAASAGTLAATSLTAVAQASPAPAASAGSVPAYSRQLSGVKAKAANKIATRVRSLDNAIAGLGSYSFLGPDQATMVAILRSDVSGLQALNAKIRTDTTLKQAWSDYYAIFSNFRVYELVMPVVNMVVNADHIDNVSIPTLRGDISSLQAQEGDFNQAMVGQVVAAIKQHYVTASSATSGISAQLLAYTAAQWDANHGLLDPARASLATADQAVEMAEREYYEALRYLYHHPTTAMEPPGPTTSTTSRQGRLVAIQHRASRAISARLEALHAAIALVRSKPYLGPDQATLVSEMQSDISALQALDANLQASTTLPEALSYYGDIFSQLRVYYLVVPVVKDVIRVDYLANIALPTANQEISSLESQVDASDQGVLSPLVTDAQDQLQAATAAISGLPSDLVTFTPAEWNANHKLLAGASTDIRAASKAIATSAKYYAKALAYLRDGLVLKHPSKGPHHSLAPRHPLPRPGRS